VVAPFFAHISRLRPWKRTSPISAVACATGGTLFVSPWGSSTQTKGSRF
jgi:hypothetical protein